MGVSYPTNPDFGNLVESLERADRVFVAAKRAQQRARGWERRSLEAEDRLSGICDNAHEERVRVSALLLEATGS